jgi:hypothetical protein
MADDWGNAKDGWLARLQQRRQDRRDLRADRRARRKGRIGMNPGDAAERATSSTFTSGGYFTKGPKP